MKKTLRKAMLSTICMLIVAVMSLTGVTYAWFTQSTEAEVKGMQMTVEAAGGGLQISMTGTEGSWKSSIVMEDFTKAGVTPCSTVDAQNFFDITVDPTDPTKAMSNALGANTNNVIVQTLYIRNTGYTAIDVDLDGTQFIDPDTATESKEDDDGRNASLAARLAVLKVTRTPAEEEGGEETVTKEVLFILSPNETYQGIKRATSGLSESEKYFEYGATNDSNNLATPTNLQTTAADCKIRVNGITLDENNEVQYHDVEIEIVIWIEGQDKDCENKNSNSSFDIDVQFNSEEVTSAS